MRKKLKMEQEMKQEQSVRNKTQPDKSQANQTLQIHHIALSELTPDPSNARKHSRRNLKAIAESLKRFGQQKPIVVNQHNQIIAGHGTFAAAASIGWQTIAMVRSDLAGNEAMAYAIADNRSAELAQWNNDILAQQLATLQIDPTLPSDACGFDEAQIQAVIDEATGLVNDPPIKPDTVFQLLVTCSDEADQKRVYGHLSDEGYCCRVLTL